MPFFSRYVSVFRHFYFTISIIIFWTRWRFDFNSVEMIVILSAVLLAVKSAITFAVFWIRLFEAVFIASVVFFLALSRSFWLYLLLKYLAMFSVKDKNAYPFRYILFLGSIDYLVISFLYNGSAFNRFLF